MKIDLIDRMRNGVRRLGLESWILAQRNLMRSQIVYKLTVLLTNRIRIQESQILAL